MLIVLVLIIFLLVLILINLYLIAPNAKRDCSDFKGIMIAHRGLHGDGVPENSLLAFKRAKEAGYGVELDVQYSKDGSLVVFHDDNLLRMCGVDKKVSDCTLEELRSYRLASSDEKIPLLAEAIEVLDDVPLVCEVKNHNGNFNYKLCKDTYTCLCSYKGVYCVESFSPFLLRWFRKNEPQVIRGQLSSAFKKEKFNIVAKFAMSQLLVNVFSRPDFIAYRYQDKPQIGFKICKKYRPLLIGWTARGESEQADAFKKFDSIIFEKYENFSPVE